MLRTSSRLALACSAILPLAAQEPRNLSLELLLEWENVAAPQLSPDGTRILFTRTWTDQIQDRQRSSLWIVGRDGTGLRPLTEGSDARWSPDGTRIAFVADGEPKGPQLWVYWPETRERMQVTHVVEAPHDPRWSPDGTQIAFTMQVPEKDGFPIELPKPPKGAKWAPEPTVITRLAYRRDHQGYRPAGWRHLFVVDAVQGGTPRQVTSGDFDHAGAEWMPDGRELVFSGLRTADADWQVRESEVYAVELRSGTVRQLTDRRGPDRAPIVSPSGEWIAYTGHDHSDDTYSVGELWIVRADGTGARSLTHGFDREPTNLQWAADGESIYCTVPSEGTLQAWNVRLDGTREELTRGMHQFQLGDVGRDGTLVGVLTSPQLPPDLYVQPPGGGLQRLTSVHADVLEDVRLGTVEELRWTSPDGLAIQGWLVHPPDFDPTRKYPLILQIHGGPHAMYGVNFDFERHNHAAHGYLLLYCNPRGSTGYGKTFGNAIDNAYPGRDYDDLMGGVDAVISRGCVDTRNLFVYGGSGGGVLTCWIVGTTDRFRAAVAMYPVTNWISFVGTTDGPYWYTNFAKLPWDSIDEHWQRSPLRLAGNVKTPVMLLTGELDLRTPIGQTEEYYQALKLRKVDTVMVRVPDEYHGASARHVSNRMRRILYVRGWFEKHRVKDAAADAGSAK